MGRGGKAHKFTVSEEQKANSSASARNLRKGDLCGVIFGCKNYTINECLSQKLFGLPGLHFSYVRNILPGLPLFLFNYSDRRLHGIFEAASYGKMNINPHGWTANGKEVTEYPAQVRINIRWRCQALMENQFKPIIADNYYTDNHFWFELDHLQTSGLISLFEASSSVSLSPIPKKVFTGGSSFEASSASAHCAIPKKVFPNELSVEALSANAHSTVQKKVSPNELSVEALSANAHSTVQKKVSTWCDIVKALPNTDKRNENDDSEPTCNPDKTNGYDDPWSTASEPYMVHLDQPKMEAHPDKEAVDKEEEQQVSPRTGEVLTNLSNFLPTSDQVFIAAPMINGMPSEEQSFQQEPLEYFKAIPSITSEMRSMQKCFQEYPTNKEGISVFPSDCQSVIAQLMQEVLRLQHFSLEQLKKMDALEKNLSESQVEIQRLNIRLKMLEPMSDPTIRQITKSGWAPW